MGKERNTETPQIKWHYRYINGGKEVVRGEPIDTFEDKQGRWMLMGSIETNSKVLFPEREFYPIPYVLTCIRKAEYNSLNEAAKFTCRFPFFKELNNGWSGYDFYGETPEDVMRQVQESFDVLYKVIRNL